LRVGGRDGKNSGWAAFEEAVLHRKLIAGRMNQRSSEPNLVAGWPLMAAVVSHLRVACRAGNLKGWTAVPFLEAP
jgi:hypothetical protein